MKLDELSQNSLQSPVSTLPPETLSLILQHTCATPNFYKRYGLPGPSPPLPSTREKRAQFVLGGVCVRWRQVLFSTPSIWTSVDLVIEPDTVDKASAVLRAFLTYSGELPLAIGLRFLMWEFDPRPLIDGPSDAALHRNTHRIRELYLSSAPDAWIDLLLSLLNLTCLSLKDAYRELPPVVINNQCSHLTLRALPENAQLSCSEITTLHLYAIPINLCLKLLLHCPNLVEYRNRQPVESEEEITLPGGSFALPRMETFEWSVAIRSPFDVAMCQHIRMPALRELIWVEDISEPEDLGIADPRDDFFRNLPPTFTILRIHTTSLDSDLTASVFDRVRDTCNIEHLIFSGLCDPLLTNTLTKLTPASETGGSQRTMKLQKLKSILIEGPFIPSGDNQDRILGMLEHRYLSAGAHNQRAFRLEFSCKVVFLPHFKERLKEMIGRGLKVEILEDSKSVDWL